MGANVGVGTSLIASLSNPNPISTPPSPPATLLYPPPFSALIIPSHWSSFDMVLHCKQISLKSPDTRPVRVFSAPPSLQQSPTRRCSVLHPLLLSGSAAEPLQEEGGAGDLLKGQHRRRTAPVEAFLRFLRSFVHGAFSGSANAHIRLKSLSSTVSGEDTSKH